MNARQHLLDEAPGTRRDPIRPAAVANQLPPGARDLLTLAAQVKDPLERRIAIDRAIDVAKARFPECFHAPAKE